jgi:glycosyltransferase involved in cell wall biosynthesis
MLSLVIPVYKNQENIPRLLHELAILHNRLGRNMETVFVVDGSPDDSYETLASRLPDTPLRSQLLLLSRNFGSFSAIAAGLAHGTGEYFAVIAADLQEPPELVADFYDAMRRDEADIVFGIRSSRADPWLSELFSGLFWGIYRRFVVRDMPPGGVDVFGCTRKVRDELLSLQEVNTNLIALLFWLGFRRKFIPYVRQPRREGQSAWTFAKKLQYFVNSIFNFTDLPIRVLLGAGFTGAVSALIIGIVVLACRLFGVIDVPGYTAIILAVMFFGGLTALGLGIVGQYLWLALQNNRKRPNYIVRTVLTFENEARARRSAASPPAGRRLTD